MCSPSLTGDFRAVEGEAEGKQKVNPGSEANVEERGGKRGGPKKLFKWNEEIRPDIKMVS